MTDLRALERFLRSLPGALASGAAVDAARDAAAELRGAVVARAPVDSGAFVHAVKAVGPARKGLAVEAAVEVDAADLPSPGELAAVEFGTHTHAAHAPMRRAADEEGPSVAGRMARRLAEAVKRETS